MSTLEQITHIIRKTNFCRKHSFIIVFIALTKYNMWHRCGINFILKIQLLIESQNETTNLKQFLVINSEHVI